MFTLTATVLSCVSTVIGLHVGCAIGTVLDAWWNDDEPTAAEFLRDRAGSEYIDLSAVLADVGPRQ